MMRNTPKKSAACIVLSMIGSPLIRANASTLNYIYTFHIFGELQGENTPVGPLVALKGLLYGTAQGGGASGLQGALFSVDPATGREVNLYTFPYSISDTKAGEQPDSGLIAVNGSLYGTTLEGHGADLQNNYYRGYGTVFQLRPTSGSVRTVHGFSGSDGSQPEPYHDPLIYLGGAIYGTAFFEGPHGAGTVFKLSPGGEFSIIYSFPSSLNGCNPMSLIGSGSTLYGTTAGCGGNGAGTIYSIDLLSNTQTVLYSFPAGTRASGKLLLKGRELIGTTFNGGANGAGSVYKIAIATGQYTLLHSFSTSGDDGNYPSAGLTLNNGVAYGVTEFGPGPNSYGTLYTIDADTGVESVLANFSYSGVPLGALISVDGLLYGTTTNVLNENSLNNGTVFRFTP